MQIAGSHQMAPIVRRNDESVRGGYIKNTGRDGTFIAIPIDVLLGFLWGRNGNSFQPTQEEERGYVNYESYIYWKFVICVPLTATHCGLPLAWSGEHVLWTPQKWACVMFPNSLGLACSLNPPDFHMESAGYPYH
ncbi:transposable element Tcb1 transposase [Trichonephila clavipes]|uniref:Transposable element Tcb1 transposase n=1 Tax=Trichonephila clavipes TaxID=2585209 RepID=A0A8X6S3M5_TRICX|nr:transposable element Tcb1 transposase [Trichonephila clavipes]